MSWPRLKRDFQPLRGLAAVALFVVMAAAFLPVEFPAPAFPNGASVIDSIGAAILGIDPAAIVGEDATPVPVASFLAALIIVGVLLDAALDGALMLAERDEGGEE